MLPLPILFEDDLDETIILDSDDNENMFQFRDAAPVTTNWPMNSDCDGDGVSDGVDWNGDGAMNQFRMPATLGDRGLSIDLNEDGEIDIAALEGCDVDPSSNEATTVNRPPISKPNGPYIEECQGAVAHVQLDGSASFDPDGDPIVFYWSTNCPGGFFNNAASATPILTLTSPPPCPVSATPP